MSKVKCQYCNLLAKLVDGSVIYPHLPALKSKYFYLCKNCGAYCGCHPNSTRVLGTLADKTLRTLRKMAHSYFDKIWQSNRMSRRAAYSWLAYQMKINVKDTHISWFNDEQCKMVIDLSKRYLDKESKRSTKNQQTK